MRAVEKSETGDRRFETEPRDIGTGIAGTKRFVRDFDPFGPAVRLGPVAAVAWGRRFSVGRVVRVGFVGVRFAGSLGMLHRFARVRLAAGLSGVPPTTLLVFSVFAPNNIFCSRPIVMFFSPIRPAENSTDN
jgi:hypothetical protein